MQLNIFTDLIVGAVGFAFLLLAMIGIGYEASRQDSWKTHAFLAFSSALIMFLGLVRAGDGLYKLGQNHTKLTSAITANVVK